MKSIILFRHGDSNWGYNSSDFDRPLTETGILESKKMGIFLKKRSMPDLVISSSANRAKTTSQLAISSGHWECPILFERKIYGGSPSFLIKLINKQDNNFTSICLVGHEPNFSKFIEQTTNSDYINFSTAAMAKVDFEVSLWDEISYNIGALDWLISPKDLNDEDLY